jgi:hypothetical protein
LASDDVAVSGLTAVTVYSVTPVAVVPTASIKLLQLFAVTPLLPFHAIDPMTASVSFTVTGPVAALALTPSPKLELSTGEVALMLLNSKAWAL